MISLTEREIFITLVCCDRLKFSDAIVLLEGDGFERINKTVELYKNKWSDKIIVAGGLDNQLAGSIPSSYLCSELKKKGIPEESIILEEKSINTREQATNVNDIMVKSGWKRIIIVASHYHQFRAYLTFLKVVFERNQKFEIINAPANNLLWFETLMRGDRYSLLYDEFQKIDNYSQKGHIASFGKAIEYQKWKEQQ